MAQKVLVFPGGMEASLNYLNQVSDKQLVLGASSLPYDPASKHFQTWLNLPYINESSFDQELLKHIEKYNIDAIFSPHRLIWQYLSENLNKLASHVALLGDPPADNVFSKHSSFLEQAHSHFSNGFKLALLSKGQSPLNHYDKLAFLKHAFYITGESDISKLVTLCEVFRFIPSGDIVEIGSSWGRSAFALAYLARYFDIGSLLCIDPWSLQEAQLDDLHEDIRDTYENSIRNIDVDKVLEGFIINLLPYSMGHINYLKMTSHDAFNIYCNHSKVESAEFGITQYQGEIACLHIDGNHDYIKVKEDVEKWTPLVKTGGWIIIDDYLWALGDGPQRAGNEYLEANKQKIACAFVVGNALFVQI